MQQYREMTVREYVGERCAQAARVPSWAKRLSWWNSWDGHRRRLLTVVKRLVGAPSPHSAEGDVAVDCSGGPAVRAPSLPGFFGDVRLSFRRTA